MYTSRSLDGIKKVRWSKTLRKVGTVRHEGTVRWLCWTVVRSSH